MIAMRWSKQTVNSKPIEVSYGLFTVVLLAREKSINLLRPMRILLVSQKTKSGA